MKKHLFHPLVFALFPVVSLYLYNSEVVLPGDILLASLYSLLLLLAVWLFFFFATRRSWSKSAILASTFMLLFFAFGHVVNWLRFLAYEGGSDIAYLLIGSKQGLAIYSVLFVALLCLMYWLLSMKEMPWVTTFFNAVAGVILASILMNAYLVYQQEFKPLGQFTDAWEGQIEGENQGEQITSNPESTPDIYYIILDSYARSDVMQDMYGYDNSEFLSFLKDQGFYVAERSRPNYPLTVLSVASTLNYMYLDVLTGQLGSEYASMHPLRVITENNRLFHLLRQHGYVIRSLPTGYFLTESVSADIVEAPEQRANSFQTQVVNITPLPVMYSLLGLQHEDDRHRSRILYALERLGDRPETNQPVFTFVHILAPHAPFVFDRDGNPAPVKQTLVLFGLFDGEHFTGTPEEYVSGYHEQAIFISNRIQDTIRAILQNPRPAIIIIQGDHGPGSRYNFLSLEGAYLPERMAILMTVYLPDGDYSQLYPEITPVNLFRVVVNQFFGAGLERLDDRSYYASIDRPYQFVDVTDRLK